MANKILYDDKETFQTSELDEVNKATAANYNEIKDVVNFNADALDNISLSIKTTGIITISSAEILDLFTNPKEIIAAPGVNKIISLKSIWMKSIFNTTAYTISSAPKLQYDDGTFDLETGFAINSANDEYWLSSPDFTTLKNINTDITNKNVVFAGITANPTLGDGIIEMVATYEVLNV